MEKRYQVFVSSTYSDLQQERQEVIQALLELDCIPAGMELFPAADDDQWSVIKNIIDDCDYYILILAGRYGSISSETGISYTQMEYEYALSQGKPIVAFLHRNVGSIESARSEQSEDGRVKLNEFRELAQRKLCKFWETSHELGSVVSRSLIQLKRQKPAVGWVRADQALDASAAQEILRLKTKVEQLEAELTVYSAYALEESAALSQGEDTIELQYKIFFDTGYQSDTETREVNLSWNDIFVILAPHMMCGLSELEMCRVLEGLIYERNPDLIELNDHNEDVSVSHPSLTDEDFQTVKIQLRALNLIEQSGTTDDKGKSLWNLTSHGDKLMMTLKAIKKTT